MKETISSGAPFQPGDVVQLKSSGPAMTVVAVEADGVHVLWYGEADDSVKSHVIPVVALERLTDFDDDDDEYDDDDDEDEDDEEPRAPKRRGAEERRRDD